MSDQMSSANSVQNVERVLVALDASPHSLYALKAAAELAALMQAELQGLYVEDINLVRICGLSFVREIGSYSASARPVDTRRIEREFRMQAAQIRHEVAQTAVAANVKWTFRTTRGAVTNELLAAAESAGMLTMGRVGRSMGKHFGSTARTLARKSLHPVVILGKEGLSAPPIVLYDGTPAADRALHLAVSLFRRSRDDHPRPLVLIVTPLPAEPPTARAQRAQNLAAQLTGRGITVRTVIFDHAFDEATDDDALVDADLEEADSVSRAHALLSEEISRLLDDMDGGTLILPMAWSDLLSNTSRSAVVTP